MRLGVAGWPVAHSRSPAMHNAALRACGLTGWRYQLLPIPPELFDETVPALATQGFRGINVTIPHKERALALATQASASARAIGAANVLLFEPDGKLRAENTDAPSLSGALGAVLDLRGATVLVLGAGGSARAAVWALLDAGARQVRVWNRTRERAQALGATFGAIAVTEATPADVLVNCTSVGLSAATASAGLPLEPGDLDNYRVVVDFVYTDGGTQLLADARAAGVPAIDGLELLVGQGALSFERFTGSAAPVEVMRRAAGMLGADEHSTPAAGD
jgi:shikimate dehydrogenase